MRRHATNRVPFVSMAAANIPDTYLHQAPALLVALRDAQQRLAAGEDVRVGGQQSAAAGVAGTLLQGTACSGLSAGTFPSSSGSSSTEELPAFPDNSSASYSACSFNRIAAGAMGLLVDSRAQLVQFVLHFSARERMSTGAIRFDSW